MLSILNFKFLRFVKLDNCINQSEMKELFIKPFEHLSTLFIKNIYLENKIFYLLSKANWPRLKKLAIEPPTKITDDAGIKYLQKQTQFKLINL